MKITNKSCSVLALVLAMLFLLAGCGNAGTSAGTPAEEAQMPAETVSPAVSSLPGTLDSEDLPEDRYAVSTVDEFLAALGSHRVIQLADGVYNLTEAENYGDSRVNSSFYYWYDSYDGYELRLNGVEDLYIVGSSPDAVSFVTVPRYANVLAFEWCSDVHLCSVTAGHTPAPGYCSGGVLSFNTCSNMFVSDSVLYGCGTIGISAQNCTVVSAESTVIKECSFGAVEAHECVDVRFIGGKVYYCGTKAGFTAYDLFSAVSTNGFAVLNTEIYNNLSQTLLNSSYSQNVLMRGCEIHDNTFAEEYLNTDAGGKPVPSQLGGVFHISGGSPVYADNLFAGNSLPRTNRLYYEDMGETGFAVDAEGNKLSEIAELEAMELKLFTDKYSGPESTEFLRPQAAPVYEPGDETETEVYVDNVDDFLAAIGSNTTIHVDTALLDLSAASNYGGFGGNGYYRWEQTYDGPNLVLSGVHDLHIVGQGKDKTTVQAVPRYAEVLTFEDCSQITIEGLTAGHKKELPGYCSGDVLEFRSCTGVFLQDCGLFGCGVNGIMAENSSGMTVLDTEIYDCLDLGAVLYSCSDVTFSGCRIHDCGNNSIFLDTCRNVNWGGELLNGMNPVS